MTSTRDYSTISPSAKSLLMVRAQTSLPYAHRAAELLWGAEAVTEAQRETERSPSGPGRRRHFELRARSIDEAIAARGATRILELAAGLSFRGLDLAARRADVTYLDTDLPDIAALKADLVAQLHPEPLLGSLRVQPLDALDRDAFRATIARLPSGDIAIVQEGLLMYLGDDEKATLAASVRSMLLERGGAWITSDIYIRSAIEPQRDERTKAFLQAHRVEDNKFASWDAAAAFFAANGLRVAERHPPPVDPWPVRETWVVEAMT
jgi:O-methyltransferase involved in polyketide biosynthesis